MGTKLIRLQAKPRIGKEEAAKILGEAARIATKSGEAATRTELPKFVLNVPNPSALTKTCRSISAQPMR